MFVYSAAIFHMITNEATRNKPIAAKIRSFSKNTCHWCTFRELTNRKLCYILLILGSWHKARLREF